ncbi:MAG: sigma 54-interacting transcriptional regulator [Fibrobacterota bacterium]
MESETCAKDITGNSLPLRKILKTASRIYPANCTVLTEREGITGKELIAIRKHKLSKRKPGRFMEINCATLFIDEIAETSSATRVKLLRALQDDKVKTAGVSEVIIDHRIDFSFVIDDTMDYRTGKRNF